ncbi:MAG: GMP synthase (glutamine-hydrolyzing) [Gammaproteobacteria bacterium]|nr:MAG: GMP synthase (glutamine-hydrolyzing) [Gammaproteobacteria bacterium]
MQIRQDKIIVIDFGSQYSQLIARRVREAGVFCQLKPSDISYDEIKKINPRGIILSGGPESVGQKNASKIDNKILDSGIPILGICYGMQLITEYFGGKIEKTNKHEFGFAQVRARGHSDLLNNIEDHTTDDGFGILDVWMSHADIISKLPDGFDLIGSSDNAPIAAMAHQQKNIYALQFHPEVTHTKQGSRILSRFVLQICKCKNQWSAANIIDDSIEKIKQQVGSDQVILGLSGGVDSSVVAVLLHKAIGDNLTCIFVDNGLLRLNEGDEVMRTFASHLNIKVIRVNAQSRFLNALKGEADPEKKRKIIGHMFIEIFEEQAAKLPQAKFLAQGTIYPDVIESSKNKANNAHLIKAHHNVGGLPDYMKLDLIEPLNELFKDEVRAIGLKLGLNSDMINRHPFPGPGLGVRILGEVKEKYTKILQQADDVFIKELIKDDLYHKTSQAFAVFLPIKSVGVTGDGRRYEYVIALRAVETVDFMTARWAHLPYDFLEKVSTKIINEIKQVSRVTYDISSKPPATIEWE